MHKKRRKAPRNTFWNEGILWGRKKIKGRDHKWSLRTNNAATAKVRVRQDIERLVQGAFYGDNRMSYSDAMVSWAEDHLPHSDIGPKTAKRYAVSLKQIAPHLHGLFVDEIDREIIKGIVKARRIAGVSTATIRRDLTALSSVLSHAEDEEWREGNPALDRLRKLKERRDPIVLPDPAHVARIIASAPGNLASMIAAARVTGCRQDELVTAQRAGLDHARRELTVIGKGNKLRVIGLDYGGGYDLLRAIPASAQCKALFWHGNKKNKPYRNVSSRFALLVRQEFARAYDAVHGTTAKTRPPIQELLERQDEAGWTDIGFRPFRFHDLRHLHAVEWLRSGGSIYDLQGRLGHRSITTTEMYLKFLTPEEQRRVKHAGEQKGEQRPKFSSAAGA